MKEFKIMAEYGCYPVWIRNSQDEIFVNTPVYETSLSDSTKSKLTDWDMSFQITYNQDTPQDSGFSDQSEINQFENEGLEIWKLAIGEISNEYLVTYYSYIDNTLLYP